MKHTAEAYQNGRTVTLIYPFPPQIPQGTVDVEITAHKASRTEEANNYYWEIVTAISGALNEPKTKVHNRMLRDYGTLARSGDFLVPLTLPDTEAERKKIDQEMNYHVLPTSTAWEENGYPFRVYYLIKGSHLYNTKEMSKLINGAVQEAANLGLETMTPEEQEAMMAAYEQYEM